MSESEDNLYRWKKKLNFFFIYTYEKSNFFLLYEKSNFIILKIEDGTDCLDRPFEQTYLRYLQYIYLQKIRNYKLKRETRQLIH